MRGHWGRANWQMAVKPDAIKGARGKWGKGAGKGNALTWGDLRPSRLRWQSSSKGEAEGAGVSRSHSTVADPTERAERQGGQELGEFAR